MDTTDSTKSNLDVYREFFETPFINATEVYYTTESEKFISENSIPDYMKKVRKSTKLEVIIITTRNVVDDPNNSCFSFPN